MAKLGKRLRRVGRRVLDHPMVEEVLAELVVAAIVAAAAKVSGTQVARSAGRKVKKAEEAAGAGR